MEGKAGSVRMARSKQACVRAVRLSALYGSQCHTVFPSCLSLSPDFITWNLSRLPLAGCHSVGGSCVAGGCGHQFNWNTMKPANTFYIGLDGSRKNGLVSLKRQEESRDGCDQFAVRTLSGRHCSWLGSDEYSAQDKLNE